MGCRDPYQSIEIAIQYGQALELRLDEVGAELLELLVDGIAKFLHSLQVV